MFGTLLRLLASSTCRTALLRPPTCGPTAFITRRRVDDSTNLSPFVFPHECIFKMIRIVTFTVLLLALSGGTVVQGQSAPPAIARRGADVARTTEATARNGMVVAQESRAAR